MAGRQEIATFHAFTEQEMREYAQAKAAAEFRRDVIGYIESLRADEHNSPDMNGIIDVILEYIYADCGELCLPINGNNEV